MSNKAGTIAKIESAILFVLAVSMVPPLFIALFNGESSSATAFFIVSIFATVLALLIQFRFKEYNYKLKNRDAYLVVALAWVIATFVGAMPFYISGNIPSFADAFFESCSGFSTTGCSILTDIESMPRSILFWRSFTHWLGGMGIVVFITAIIPAFGLNGQIVANAETTGPVKDKIAARFSDGSKYIYNIYIGMTLVETLLLKLSGLSLFDSLIHTFGTVGTGGLSSYNDSIGHFNNVFAEIIIMIFMFLAAINFNLYYVGLKHGIKAIFKDEETRFYSMVVLYTGAVIALYNFIFNGFENLGRTILNAFFQVVSIITTTGYMTDDYDAWPTFSKFMIFTLFFVGGCSSSTGGGIKCVRVCGGFKLILRGIYSRIHPSIISPVTLNGKEMSNDTAIRISHFIFTYIIVLFAGTIALSINGFDLMTNLSAAASCLGNVGPGFNLVGPTMNYAFFSDFSKYICSFLMITGRLELYTILVLFSRNYWNHNRLR